MTEIAAPYDETAAAAARETQASPPTSMPFEELVRAECRLRQAEDDSASADVLEKLDAERDLVRARFERREGNIVEEFWTKNAVGGVVLTARRTRGLRRLFGRYELRLHQFTHYVVRGEPDFAELFRRLTTRTVRARSALRGMSQQLCLYRIFTSLTHAMAHLDGGERKPEIDRVVREQELDELDEFDEYYSEAAARQAQIVHLGGLVLGAVLVLAMSALVGVGMTFTAISDRDLELFFACVIAGALGAVMSVLIRMANPKRINHEVGREYVRLLGLFRPFIGAVFGLAIYFAVSSGLVPVDLDSYGDDLRFFGTLSFLAGFSERFAKDVLRTASSTVGSRADDDDDEEDDADRRRARRRRLHRGDTGARATAAPPRLPRA
jgi:hypothetical protein